MALVIRSIPACTGEPAVTKRLGLDRRVYPRVYGGTKRISRIAVTSPGLSPRVRGNHRGRRGRDLSGRSIPACTGEPLQKAEYSLFLSVYPRVYGGTSLILCCFSSFRGLSPRVRGNLFQLLLICSSYRSIPACTGEPILILSTSSSDRVYPRVYGGTRGRAVRFSP